SLGGAIFGSPKKQEVPQAPTAEELEKQRKEAEARAKKEADEEEARQNAEATAKAEEEKKARAAQQGRSKTRLNLGNPFSTVETSAAKLKAKLGQ
ncbi:hypothetical protein ADUPG1_001984, partial [Aduncisulcus paluster]